MATTNISTEIVSITGVSAHGASDDFIVSAQKFVASSIPKELLTFAQKASSPSTDGSAITFSVNDSITDVQRNGYSCREIPMGDAVWALDSTSLRYATSKHPVFYHKQGGVHFAPVTDGSNAGYVFYVDYSKIDDDSDLRNAVIYHACSSELSKLSTAELPTVSIAAVPPDVPSLTTVTFSSTDSDVDASAPTFTTATVAAAGVLGTTNGFNAYHPLSDLGDSDPGVLTISVSAPTISIVSTGVTTTAAADIATNAPAYTPPVITNAADGSFAEETNQDITEMSRATWTSLDYDFDNENIDFLKWFQVAGDFIQNEEDTELAAAQIQKINTFISAYQTAMQNKLNDFNEANAKYQASVQAQIQAQQHLAAENTQEATQTMEALIQDTSLELQKYQAQVNDEVQEYSQKLARYQLELNTTLQAWQKEYDASIQESLQELQVTNQVNIAQGQAALQVAIDNENRSQQRQLQNGINDMQAIVASNQDLISKYQSELQQYSGEVQAEVSEYQNKIQKQQSYSKEADKYYQWAKLEVTTYIQNNSKMIAATMAGRARAQA